MKATSEEVIALSGAGALLVAALFGLIGGLLAVAGLDEVIRFHGLARTVLVTDASVAPPSASGAWSPWLWIGWLVLIAAFVLALARTIFGGF